MLGGTRRGLRAQVRLGVGIIGWIVLGSCLVFAQSFVINGIDYIGGTAAGLFVTPSGAGGQLLGVDAVREYNVLPDNYGAEYGKRAGGQISIVTSSGTNQLHGSQFEFVRNSAFDARNFLEDVKGPFKRNQFGGTLGGPIKKDKAVSVWELRRISATPGAKPNRDSAGKLRSRA